MPTAGSRRTFRAAAGWNSTRLLRIPTGALHQPGGAHFPLCRCGGAVLEFLRTHLRFGHATATVPQRAGAHSGRVALAFRRRSDRWVLQSQAASDRLAARVRGIVETRWFWTAVAGAIAFGFAIKHRRTLHTHWKIWRLRRGRGGADEDVVAELFYRAASLARAKGRRRGYPTRRGGSGWTACPTPASSPWSRSRWTSSKKPATAAPRSARKSFPCLKKQSNA